jgi:hypothetical protein
LSFDLDAFGKGSAERLLHFGRLQAFPFKASSFISWFAFSTALRSRLPLLSRLYLLLSQQDVAPCKAGRGLPVTVRQPAEDPAEATLQFGDPFSALNLPLPPTKALFEPQARLADRLSRLCEQGFRRRP